MYPIYEITVSKCHFFGQKIRVMQKKTYTKWQYTTTQPF